jgi:hypothetical protein
MLHVKHFGTIDGAQTHLSKAARDTKPGFEKFCPRPVRNGMKAEVNKMPYRPLHDDMTATPYLCLLAGKSFANVQIA